MEVLLRDATLTVFEDLPVSFRGARGTRLTCTEGVVWLTQEKDLRDLHLRSGQSYLIENNGLILLEGSPRGSLRVSGLT
jgi:hypothetical protein